MPPYHKARVGALKTFKLPPVITANAADRALGKVMVDTWRKDGIFQIQVTPTQAKLLQQ